MKTINLLLALLLSFSFASCGKQDVASNGRNFYKNFINAHDGVEYKKPNKIGGHAQGSMGYNQSDILLTLDSNGTFHLRSSVPTSVPSARAELDGIRGEWETNSKGVLELRRNGKLIGESSLSYFQTDLESDKSFPINFVAPVSIEVVQLGGATGYNNSYSAFMTVEHTLQGYATVQR